MVLYGGTEYRTILNAQTFISRISWQSVSEYLQAAADLCQSQMAGQNPFEAKAAVRDSERTFSLRDSLIWQKQRCLGDCPQGDINHTEENKGHDSETKV
ncbi:hypothetical protein NQZ68_007067 [Dissostichus eleginoides]|nr:hypothetical protein NQZ68_007067 [Dissostichus eleginoides]